VGGGELRQKRWSREGEGRRGRSRKGRLTELVEVLHRALQDLGVVLVAVRYGEDLRTIGRKRKGRSVGALRPEGTWTEGRKKVEAQLTAELRARRVPLQ